MKRNWEQWTAILKTKQGRVKYIVQTKMKCKVEHEIGLLQYQNTFPEMSTNNTSIQTSCMDTEMILILVLVLLVSLNLELKMWRRILHTNVTIFNTCLDICAYFLSFYLILLSFVYLSSIVLCSFVLSLVIKLGVPLQVGLTHFFFL